MGSLCPNLALYLKFKCVWLTFYLFFLFPSADLSKVGPCHGMPWQKVPPWEPGAMWQRNSYELFMNCFIHQAHTWALSLCATISVIIHRKMSAPLCRYFSPSATDSAHWVMNSNFLLSSCYFPEVPSEMQSRLLIIRKAAYWIGTRRLISGSQVTGGQWRALIRPQMALDHEGP